MKLIFGLIFLTITMVNCSLAVQYFSEKKKKSKQKFVIFACLGLCSLFITIAILWRL